MGHALGAGWRWQVQLGGQTLHLDALLTTVLAAGVLVAGVLIAARRASQGRHGYVVGMAALSLGEIDRSVTAGPAWARRRIAGLGFTLFWFVLLSHWLHLIPAITLRAPTSDVNVTGALAIVTLAAVNITAAQVVGVRRYLAHYVKPIYLLPLRVAEIAVRTVTLSLRLFGVLFASAILVEVVNDIVPPPAALIPLVLWTAFDIVMAVVQAYIFAVLAITYYNLAVTDTAATDTDATRHTPDRHHPEAVEPRILITNGAPS